MKNNFKLPLLHFINCASRVSTVSFEKVTHSSTAFLDDVKVASSTIALDAAQIYAAEKMVKLCFCE